MTIEDILLDKTVQRFGLELDGASFDRLGEALDRISDAERAVDFTLRIF